MSVVLLCDGPLHGRFVNARPDQIYLHPTDEELDGFEPCLYESRQGLYCFAGFIDQLKGSEHGASDEIHEEGHR